MKGYKINIFDICILLFAVVVCYVYARRQFEIQELILIEQRAKIELLSNINISNYSLEEINAIVEDLSNSDKLHDIKIDWSKSYILVPNETPDAELRKTITYYPTARFIILDDEEEDKYEKEFGARIKQWR